MVKGTFWTKDGPTERELTPDEIKEMKPHIHYKAELKKATTIRKELDLIKEFLRLN